VGLVDDIRRQDRGRQTGIGFHGLNRCTEGEQSRGEVEGKAMREDRERGEGEEREAYQRRSDEVDSPFLLISFHFNLCSIKETKLFLREVKSKEQSTAQHR
jgi:hypothetical protein